jgi:DNA ligase-1
MKYLELAQLYSKLESTTKRLEKTEILSEFLKKLKHEKNKEIIYLLKGRIFPDYDAREIGISSQLTIKSLSKATGSSEGEIVKLWKKLGDLGLVAEEITKAKKQSTLSSKELTTEKVLENLQKLPELTGKGTVEKKVALISELLTSSSSLEAKYIIRTLLSDLRIGIGEGVLRDSIVWACFDKEDKEAYSLVQESYDKTNDLALVFEEACKGKSSLKQAEIVPGKPIKVMLAQKAETIEQAFETVGKPCAIEYKYDGFRMLINKDNKGEIKIFTRRLEQVTNQFPEATAYVQKYVSGKNFVIDSEAVGYNPETKEYKPFQDISQRIKRKYDIDKLQKQLPVEINVFDILYYNGKSLLKEPFQERRKLIEKIIQEKKFQIVLAKQIISSSTEQIEKFYKEALKNKQEGVMFKNLNAPYKPGSRVGYMLKYKPSMNEFDLVITGAEYGTGKRAGWLTSFDVSCKSGNKLLEIGKVSTGLKEKSSQGLSYEDMTRKLKPSITSTEEKHVQVKPELVVMVTYQNIQKSPTYSSGFALRFPRFTRLRPDRSVSDIATLEEVKKEAERQK